MKRYIRSFRYFTDLVSGSDQFIDPRNPAIQVTKTYMNWTEGSVLLDDGTQCSFSMKHFEEPSQFGIKNGRISKLSITIDGNIVCAYDRGWSIRPKSQDAKAAFNILIDEYN